MTLTKIIGNVMIVLMAGREVDSGQYCLLIWTSQNNSYIYNMSKKKIDRAIGWLQEHELISINRLEKKVGIPQRVLSKVVTGLDGRDLPAKYHDGLISELKKYGFK